MSQLESFFPDRAPGNPPLVVHPCTIASSEATWHFRERRLSLESEGIGRFGAVEVLLRARSAGQRVYVRRPEVIIGPSDRFAELVALSYGVDRSHMRVLRHPVDVERFRPPAKQVSIGAKELLFVGRLSTRKGLDLIVDLSHRLDDLAGRVKMTLIGEKSLWSDYSRLLQRLNPRIAEYIGGLEPHLLPARLQQATALIVPSRFEPGSIVTGEALACGTPVVASSEVGPSEILDTSCGRVFPDGDRSSLEGAVREILELDRAAYGLMRDAARERAVSQLAPDLVVTRLEQLLADAASGA